MTMNCSFNARMEVLFQFYLWDQSHVTLAWNTRENDDMYPIRTAVCKESALEYFCGAFSMLRDSNSGILSK